MAMDIRPGQLAAVTVIAQEASFPGSHGRARKLAAKEDDGARQGEIAVRMPESRGLVVHELTIRGQLRPHSGYFPTTLLR